MADVPSSREMANPRAGSKAKAHSMAILVTKPVARASTLAHPQEAQGCWVAVNCIGCAQVHHWQHDWYLISSLTLSMWQANLQSGPKTD